MLRIVEPEPLRHHVESTSFSRRSLIVSILFHGLLAVSLWLVVFQTFRQASITLSASPSAANQSVALEFGKPEFDVEAPWGKKVESGSDDRKVDLDAELSKHNHPLKSLDQADARFGPSSVNFFGARAYGNRFVFVLDISYSMNARNGERFERARDELIRAVQQLRPDQQYYVFLFSWYTQEMFHRREVEYVDATEGHVVRLTKWLNDTVLGAGTDPRRALSLALELNPDAVFLLSDGHFNQPGSPNSETGWFEPDGTRTLDNVLVGIKQRYRTTPIHTISLENPFTVDTMQEIAQVTGGQFRYVRTRSLAPSNFDQLSKALRLIDSEYGGEQPGKAEFELRLSYARELIGSGELASAEFVLRPVLRAEDPLVSNRVLLDQLSGILNRELRDIRLEDFEIPGHILSTVADP